MKVLIIASRYLPHHGGLETVVREISNQFQVAGHSVAIVTSRFPNRLPKHDLVDGIPVTRLQFLYPRVSYLQSRRFDLWLGGFFHFPLTLIHLLWQIVRGKWDVVNLHFVGAPSFFLLIVRSLLRFRFVVSLHGDDVEGLAHGTWFDRWVFHATLRKADAVTAYSRYLLDKAIGIEPNIAKKACVVYNGIAFEDSEAIASTDTFLAAGRMVPKKGFDVLLRAFAECRRATKILRLNLTGDGPERSALESLTRELGLTDCVSFLGSQDHAFVVRAMQTSRLVVVPSREEPFGLVALEAMAALLRHEVSMSLLLTTMRLPFPLGQARF